MLEEARQHGLPNFVRVLESRNNTIALSCGACCPCSSVSKGYLLSPLKPYLNFLWSMFFSALHRPN